MIPTLKELTVHFILASENAEEGSLQKTWQTSQRKCFSSRAFSFLFCFSFSFFPFKKTGKSVSQMSWRFRSERGKPFFRQNLAPQGLQEAQVFAALCEDGIVLCPSFHPSHLGLHGQTWKWEAQSQCNSYKCLEWIHPDASQGMDFGNLTLTLLYSLFCILGRTKCQS